MNTRRALILNVDDTPESLYAKSVMLRQAGYEVIEATTGADALRLVREALPQLVLCDVQLPDINGIEVCRRIKTEEPTRSIPVVQISATFTTEEDKLTGLEGGAEVYLTEPLEAKELETVVQVLLRLRNTEKGLMEAFQREHAARIQAEHATRLKDEFLANLSHELRTPMNIIVGWVHLLRTGELKEDQKTRALDAIGRAARSQAQLIEDLLDVSRIVTGKLRVTMREVNLRLIIEAAVESLRLAAQARQIVLNTSHDASGIKVMGDPDRLQQVFWNLLSNAVKFTPVGGAVKVHLEREGTFARVNVQDSGIGISPEFLPYVFDRFRQADGTSTREYMGMGLGLSIVRHLVELHGGSVEAISPGEGQGATFIVRIPLSTLSATAASRDAEA